MKKAIAIMLVFSLVLCAAAAMAETVADEKSFVITLTANPTTGYTWQYVLSEEGIVTVEEDFLNSADMDKLAGIKSAEALLSGAGGFSVFTVKGVKPGNVLIALEYAQSWENDDVEAGITYMLRVNEDLSVVCIASTLGVDD